MFDAAGWFAAAAAVLLTGLSKTGLGGAFGGLAVPLMAMWIAPRDAAAVMLPILVVMDLLGLRAYWGQWDHAELRRLIPAALLGVVLASLVFGGLSESSIKLIVGAISLAFALHRLVPRKFAGRRYASARSGWLWGAASGFTSTVAHAGGPPLLAYLLRRDLDKRRFVATTVGFFAAVNASKLLPYLLLGLFSRRNLLTTAELAPLAPVGVVLGLQLQRLIPERPFFVLATALLGLSGLKLLLDGLGLSGGF